MLLSIVTDAVVDSLKIDFLIYKTVKYHSK